MPITFGTYTFPEPEPLLSLDLESVEMGGLQQAERQAINVIGFLTGNSLIELNSQKNEMIDGLVRPFAPLSVECFNFPLAELSSLEFSESDLTTLLPYSVQFEAYPDGGGEFFGIESATDEWSYKENEDKTLTATHSISAKALNVDGTNPFERAKAFVTSRTDGYENISKIHEVKGQVGYLRSISEVIDIFNGSYEITYEYLVGVAEEHSNDAVVRYSAQVDYSKEGGLSVSVSGSIIGEIDGPPVSESMFSKEDARDVLVDYIAKSKSNTEDGKYPFFPRLPDSSSYTEKEDSNTIEFTFQFDNLESEDEDIIHEYAVTYEENSDSGVKTATISGTVRYVGTNNPFNPSVDGDPSTSVRFGLVKSFFNSISPFGILNGLAPFQISDDLKNSSVSKKPYEFSIDYSFSYQSPLAGLCPDLKLGGGSVSYSESLPTSKTALQSGIERIISTKLVEATLGSVEVTITSNNEEVSLDDLESCANLLFVAGDVCKKTGRSTSESPSSKSVTVRGIR
jgi:hypothetical protein